MVQFGETLTYRLFTRKEIGFGNRIVYEASSLQYASMNTKLQLVQLVDRGIMNANEVRAVFNLPPIPGGEVYVRRLDTVPTEEQPAEGHNSYVVNYKALGDRISLTNAETGGGEIDGET